MGTDTPDMSSHLFEEVKDLLPHSAPNFDDAATEEDSGSDEDEAGDMLSPNAMLSHMANEDDTNSSENNASAAERMREFAQNFAGRRVDKWMRNRWVAGFYKPMLPEYPGIIQFWTEMNHRYGDLLMQKVDRYSFDIRFMNKYDLVSFKARRAELIDTAL